MPSQGTPQVPSPPKKQASPKPDTRALWSFEKEASTIAEPRDEFPKIGVCLAHTFKIDEVIEGGISKNNKGRGIS